ncbi:MAG: polyprenyl diphosphate synthase [Lysobacterales bacterium]
MNEASVLVAPDPTRVPGTLREELGCLPRHIAIVMDGNGRWASQRRRPRTFGHRAGQKAVRAAVEFCLREGIQALTLFAFSSENWQRPASEIKALMDLFLRALDREIKSLQENNVRLRFIGDLDSFDGPLRQRMARGQTVTQGNTALALNVAVSYGGRWDITQACQRLARQVQAGELAPEAIDEAAIDARLSLAELPPLDLLIRTGGERRISNFLLWQLAYAELYFTETLWPDIDPAAMRAACVDFAGRERRYGLTSEQVQS